MAYFGDFLKCVALYYVFNRLAKVEVAGSSPVCRSSTNGLVKPFFLFVNFFTRFTLRHSISVGKVGYKTSPNYSFFGLHYRISITVPVSIFVYKNKRPGSLPAFILNTSYVTVYP